MWLVSRTCPGANGQQFKHAITISTKGNDSGECLVNKDIACKHLDYVLNATINQNSTALFIEPGYYHLHSSFAFWHVKQFAIIGSSTNSQDIIVNCSSMAGLSFIYSQDIIMNNITFSSCGSLQNSTTRGHPQFLVGLFLVNCIGLEMNGVLIIDGPGIGMQLYDVTGTVTILNCHFLKNGNNSTVTSDASEFVTSGGGLYVEYTFEGGLWPFNGPPNLIYQENSIFYVYYSSFEHNVSPRPANDSVASPNGSNHVAFGRGGGVSVFMKGHARNNLLCFKVCRFKNNNAGWGAGFFIEFQDNTQNNTVKFEKTKFSGNKAQLGGGGTRIGLIANLQKTNIPNVVEHISCLFEKNMAILGGAISLYGTRKLAYFNYKRKSFVNFTSCMFHKNGATVGSAIGCALWSSSNFGANQGNSVKLFFMHCNFTNNEIILTEDKKVTGTGGLYSQSIPILLSDVNFSLNNGSAVVLDSADVQINGIVVFSNNTGGNGGAIALYGGSILHLARQSQLQFLNNICYQKGGAIYVKNPGPPLVAFKTTGLNTHTCFILYEDEENFDPNNWNVNVTFLGNFNRGQDPASGASVFATTLQYCRMPDENRINNTALEWNTFHYFFANGTKSDMVSEIATEAVEMKVDRSEWNVTADKSFSPMLKLFDEKNKSVYGIINVELPANGPVTIDPPSAYYFAKDRIQSITIQGKPHSPYNVTLSTVDSQLVTEEIHNIFIDECSPGFVSNKNSCKCDLSDIGISRCEDKYQLLFLLKGYWGGYVKSSGKRKFVTIPCPENYCFCNHTQHSINPASDGECFFNMSKQCYGNREGVLCGQCKTNFSLKVGENNCVDDCRVGLRWIGYLIGLISFLTVLVLIIIYINFDPFSAYLNAWLYSYQVIILLLPEGITLDPFLTFIIGLANVRIVGFGGVCMWSSIDDLQKLAFNYLLPMYFFFCLFVLNRIAVAFPNNRFTRHLTQTSTARAFCTLFVLSYSTIVNLSLNILYPIKIGDKYYVFYQGTKEYFGSYHIGFAIVAILLLIFVGLLFPLMLMRRQWFSFIDKFLMKLLLDNFQKCFRDGFKWCSSFYFICRFVMLLISTFVPSGALNVSLLQSVCCVILMVFALCKPYAESNGLISHHLLNISDAVLLCNLCVLSSFGGSLSGIFLTRLYYNSFKNFIQILCYFPLLYSFGLLVYILKNKCVSSRHVHLQDVDT